MIRILRLIEDEARHREEVQRVEAERRQQLEANRARLVTTLLPLLPPAEEGAKHTFYLGTVHISGEIHIGLCIQMTCQKGQWVPQAMDHTWNAALEYLLADVME